MSVHNQKKSCFDDKICCSSVIDTIQEPILIIDKKYRIVDANKPACMRFKRERNNLVGQLCYEITHNSNRPCFEIGMPCPVKIALETGQQSWVIHEHHRPNNTISWDAMHASLLKDKKGQVALVIEEIRDVTELLVAKEVVKHFSNNIKEQRSFVPICASCKRIRNDKGDWEYVEDYIQKHSKSDLTHTICSECHKKLYPNY